MMESLIGIPVLTGCFIVAFLMGAVVHKTNFCTMGAVSDWVNIGDKGRFGAWLLAIAVAMTGVFVLEALGTLDLSDTRPPYRTAGFAWLRYLLGGIMFGIGMTLASGCTSKTLIRLGGGNMKSLIVLIVAGIFAYLMTMTDFYAVVFLSWMQPLMIDLTRFDITAQDLGSLVAGVTGGVAPLTVRMFAALLLSVLIILFILRSRGLRNNGNNLFGGIVVGLAIVAGWYLSGGPWGQQWLAAAEWLDQPPVGVAVQSYTFVNPLGELLVFFGSGGNPLLLTFGVVAVFGMLLGSLAYALTSGGFRVEWFVSWNDLLRHVLGGTLMGIGGVLAMGCTIGQGISGTSTLALGSFLALGSIILGSATTMKIEYYKMLYENASWLDAFITGWADLHLLPNSLRRLEAL